LEREKEGEADVVVMTFGFATQHRSFPIGEREGDRGPALQRSTVLHLQEKDKVP